MTQIVVGISDIVRLHFGYDLEEDSFSYNRFMTHLQYLAQRIVSDKLSRVLYLYPKDCCIYQDKLCL